MKRKLALLVAPERLEIIEEEIPALGEKELLVRVVSSGLCHSDMPPWLGESSQFMTADDVGGMHVPPPYPLRFGHEAQGVVEDIGAEVTGFKVGDIVTGSVKPGYASYAICPEDRISIIPKGPKNPFDCIAEPLMCIVNIVRVACPEFGDTVAVIGCGSMGLLTISGLRNSGARNLVALDLLDERLEEAKKWGATHTVNPLKEDAEKAVFEISGGYGADVAVEISGSIKGLDTALTVLKDAKLWSHPGRAKLLIPTLYGRDEKWSGKSGYALMNKAPIIHSTHPRYAMDIRDNYRRAILAYEDDILPIDRMITHRFKLEEINKGFETLAANKDGFIKGVLDLS